jgi:hypothetical protein
MRPNARLMFRLSVAFGGWSQCVHRNWGGIRVWAEELKPMLER